MQNLRGDEWKASASSPGRPVLNDDHPRKSREDAPDEAYSP